MFIFALFSFVFIMKNVCFYCEERAIFVFSMKKGPQ